MEQPPRLTSADLLKLARKVDPDARLVEHRWGFTELLTSAFDCPSVLIANPRAMSALK